MGASRIDLLHLEFGNDEAPRNCGVVVPLGEFLGILGNTGSKQTGGYETIWKFQKIVVAVMLWDSGNKFARMLFKTNRR